MQSKVLLHPSDTEVLISRYSWCGPCKTLSPLLEKVTSDEKVKSGSDRSLDLVTVDTDVEQELAMQYGVRACHHAVHAEAALTHLT